MKLRFYRKETRWYADVPGYIEAGGTEEECEMVAGADTWLDYISNYGDELWLELSTDPLRNFITKVDEDEYGATYLAHEYNEESFNHQLWICPVTLFVFGSYPDVIYYQKTNPFTEVYETEAG